MKFDQSPIKRKAGASRPAHVDGSRVQYALKPYREFTDEQLMNEAGGTLVCDTECFGDYWLAAFQSKTSGLVVTFEVTDSQKLNAEKLMWIMLNFKIVGFNFLKYDLLMIFGALRGLDNKSLSELNNDVIINDLGRKDREERFMSRLPKMNIVDLIEVAPLKGSLKKYAARLHEPSLQDLPFDVGSILGHEKRKAVCHYCIEDLGKTLALLNELEPQLESREVLSKMYNINLMSKSDAQIAEAVIVSEVTKLRGGNRPLRPVFSSDTKLTYNVPDHIYFQTPQLKALLQKIRESEFELDNGGSPKNPSNWGAEGVKLHIGKAIYTFGMGGLHSTESNVAHKSNDEFVLKDRDVASFYPRIIINQRLFPSQMGAAFLDVYESLVEQRLAAKAAKNSPVADGLKITINGGFGKFGSMYSTFYAPELLLQVTLSGQLYLLMLIEAIEGLGMQVVSANTDGIVTKVPRNRESQFDELIKAWEGHTNFETEETIYDSLYSRDVNNYIAFKPGGKHKGKGIFSDHWDSNKRNIFKLHKNPQTLICTDAIVALVHKGTPVEKTIKECKDITRFVSVMDVKGGAVKDGTYLGKVVRWYYAKDEKGCIIYKSNSKKVPKSDGGKPLMEMGKDLPADIDYDWYIKETIDLLFDLDYFHKPTLGNLW